MAIKISGDRTKLATSLSEINVIPLVDIMLVLLIIFMITAPMMHTGIEVNLPAAETKTSPAEERLILSITKEKEVYLGKAKVNFDLLEERLKEYYFGKEKKVLFLKADRDVPYGYVVSVLDKIHKAGVETIGLMVEPIIKR